MLMTVSHMAEETGIRPLKLRIFLARYAVTCTKRTNEFGKTCDFYDITEKTLEQLAEWLRSRIRDRLDEIEAVEGWLLRSKDGHM